MSTLREGDKEAEVYISGSDEGNRRRQLIIDDSHFTSRSLQQGGGGGRPSRGPLIWSALSLTAAFASADDRDAFFQFLSGQGDQAAAAPLAAQLLPLLRSTTGSAVGR